MVEISIGYNIFEPSDVHLFILFNKEILSE